MIVVKKSYKTRVTKANRTTNGLKMYIPRPVVDMMELKHGDLVKMIFLNEGKVLVVWKEQNYQK